MNVPAYNNLLSDDNFLLLQVSKAVFYQKQSLNPTDKCLEAWVSVWKTAQQQRGQTELRTHQLWLRCCLISCFQYMDEKQFAHQENSAQDWYTALEKEKKEKKQKMCQGSA